LASPEFTSPGENKIGSEIFKSLPPKISKQFFEFLNVCWENNWIPNRWKKSKIKLIAKENSPEYATEFRLFNILNHYKLPNKIIHQVEAIYRDNTAEVFAPVGNFHCFSSYTSILF